MWLLHTSFLFFPYKFKNSKKFFVSRNFWRLYFGVSEKSLLLHVAVLINKLKAVINFKLKGMPALHYRDRYFRLSVILLYTVSSLYDREDVTALFSEYIWLMQQINSKMKWIRQKRFGLQRKKIVSIWIIFRSWLSDWVFDRFQKI